MFTASSALMRRLFCALVITFGFAQTGLFPGFETAFANEKKKETAKGGGGKKAKKAPKEGESKSPEDAIKEDQAKFQITNDYVAHWNPLKPISGTRVDNPEKTLLYEPRFGQATVVVFLASWCLPCQNIVQDLLNLEKDFNTKNTRFVYVFTQDEAQDALGFVNAYGMNDAKHSADHMLGTDEIQKEFHYPPLPSYYVADRHGWLCMRSLQTKKADIVAIRKFLELQTSY